MTMQQLADKLAQKHFLPHTCRTKEEARDIVLSLIEPGQSVGIGGSVTIQQLDIVEDVRGRGCELSWHWLCPADEASRVRAQAIAADVYLTSCNAMTENGALVNVDGTGNRVAATLYGPGKLVFVASMDKLVADLPAAVRRIRTVASPLNCKRLGIPTPCASGACNPEADAPHICNGTVWMERAMGSHETHVVLVEEKLGY